MAENQDQETQVRIEEYIKNNWDYMLSLYQKRRFAYLLGEASYILEQLGFGITKKPVIYQIKKEETFNRTILHFNLYIGVWRLYLKITDRGEVEYEVTK